VTAREAAQEKYMTRYFQFSTDGSSYRESADEQECYNFDGDATPVEVTDLGGGAWKLRTDVYYSRGGYLELQLTQPLDRALRTFAGLLSVDTELETSTRR
jgi:hypothetical protein